MSRVVSYPHLAHYGVAFRPVAAMLGDVLSPPPMTQRTLALGAANSPEAACLPFKLTLGNFIESLDAGADLLLQAGGGCRLGYYGEVQEQILRDLGYRDFELLSITTANAGSLRALARTFKRANPRLTYRAMSRAVTLAGRKLQLLDDALDRARRLHVHALDHEGFERVVTAFVRSLDEAEDATAAEAVAERFGRELAEAAPHRAHAALRVGVVGEFYAAVEPSANHGLDRELARFGAEVFRPVTLSAVLDLDFGGPSHMRKLLDDAAPYLRFEVGTDGTKAVAYANRFQRDGFDGVVHVRPFGCIPEVNVLPAMQRLSREQAFPILSLSLDTQVSDVGMRTRVEAFCDMLRLRRAARASG